MIERFNRQHKTVSSIIMGVTLALTGLVYMLLDNRADARKQDYLDLIASNIALSTVNNLQQSAEQLRAIASIVTFSDNVSPQQFKQYVEGFADINSNWLIIEWQPIIDGDNRKNFEQHVRQHMYPDFQLWEPDDNQLPVPAQNRDEHTPVLFMVSKTEAANTIGLDLSWSSQRMRSKWRARDLGQAQLSPFFDIVLSAVQSEKLLGFAMTVPIYKGGLLPQTVASRKQEISGYIAGVFSIKQYLEPISNTELEPGLFMQVRTTDVDSKVFDNRLSDSNFSISERLTSEKEVNVFGQEWVVTLTATDTFDSPHTNSLWAFLPLIVFLAGFMLLVFVRIQYRNNLRLVATQGKLKKALIKVRKSEQYFAELSRLDPLTGLINRRAFFERIETEMSRSNRYETGLALLIADIDYFKRINDQYGHPVGDQVLTTLTHQFKKLSRESDCVCRLGGEEFAFLLINTSEQEALDFSLRLCNSIASKPQVLKNPSLKITLTISIGMTTYNLGDTASTMLSRADKALYKSKKEGRNQVNVLNA